MKTQQHDNTNIMEVQMNLTHGVEIPKYSLSKIREEAQVLQNRVDAFEELLEAYSEQQSEDKSKSVEVLIHEVREMLTYLEDEKKGDRSFMVLKWAIEDSIREIES